MRRAAARVAAAAVTRQKGVRKLTITPRHVARTMSACPKQGTGKSTTARGMVW